MAFQNLRYAPYTRTQIHSIQVPVPHTRQHNPHYQTQPLPHEINLRPQYINNEPPPHHQTSYPIPQSVIPYISWLSDPDVGQENSNALAYTYGLSTTKPHHSLLQASQSPLTYPGNSNCRQYTQDLAGGGNKLSYIGVGGNISGGIHQTEDTGLLIPNTDHSTSPPLPVWLEEIDAGGNFAWGRNHSGLWTTLNSSQTSTQSTTEGLSEHNSSSPKNPVPLIKPNNKKTLWGGSTYVTDPNAFRALSGYHRKRNAHGSFDCFEGCMKRRFGRRGFIRRGNLIVHLRSCHKQAIPDGAPV